MTGRACVGVKAFFGNHYRLSKMKVGAEVDLRELEMIPLLLLVVGQIEAASAENGL